MKNEEKERRNITWDELERKYYVATSYEECKGLLHATVSADLNVGNKNFGADIKYELAMEAALFLTDIGCEVKFYVGNDLIRPREDIEDFRILARRILVDHFLDRFLGGPAVHDYQRHNNCIKRLIRFFSVSKKHANGLDQKQLGKVAKLFEYGLSRGNRRIDIQDLISMAINLARYDLLVKDDVFEAIPILFANLLNATGQLNDLRSDVPTNMGEQLSDSQLSLIVANCGMILEREDFDLQEQAKALLQLVAKHAYKHHYRS